MFQDDFEYDITPANLLANGWDEVIYTAPDNLQNFSPAHSGANACGANDSNYNLIQKYVPITPGYRLEGWIRLRQKGTLPSSAGIIGMFITHPAIEPVASVGYRHDSSTTKWSYSEKEGVWFASTYDMNVGQWTGFRLVMDSGGVKGYINQGAGWLPFPASGAYISTKTSGDAIRLYNQLSAVMAYDAVNAGKGITLKNSILKNSVMRAI